MYVLLKYAHLAFAVVTISGFVLRGYWMLTNSEQLSRRATRIVPHVIDANFASSHGVRMTGSDSRYTMAMPVSRKSASMT